MVNFRIFEFSKPIFLYFFEFRRSEFYSNFFENAGPGPRRAGGCGGG